MSKQFQFKVSVVAAAISMMMAGGAMAITGNELVGPAITTSANATVKIDQSGTGNITSSDGTTAVGQVVTGAAFVVDQLGGATTVLTIQQVGTSNTLGLSSYTNAKTSIQVFQGADAEPGNTGLIGADKTKLVSSNQAVIEIGKDTSNRNEETDVFLTQQGDRNVAGLHLGNTDGVFTGVLNLLQVGTGNEANVTINGQTTTGKTFNIGQSGSGNLLTLVANGDQTAGMTLDFGGLNFGQTTSLPTFNFFTSVNNDAALYDYSALGANAGLKTLFTGSSTGINLRGTDGFKISAINGDVSGSDSVQVDLSGAKATGNKIDVNLRNGGNHFAVYGKNDAVINLGGSGALQVYGGKELVAYANGGTISVNGVNFAANGYLSTANGGSIIMNGGYVSLGGGLSVLQSGAAHTFSSTNGQFSGMSWNVAQTGLAANRMTVNSTGPGDSSFALTQTSEASAHSITLTNSNSYGGTAWTVNQTGAGAKTLDFTNNTNHATINATQSGDATQSATGINFAAASGSFTLVQR